MSIRLCVKRAGTGALAAAVALLACTASYAEDWIWTNADNDNDYMNGNNWTTNGVPGGPPNQEGSTKDDVAIINSNGVDKCVFAFPGGTTDNINSVDVGSGDGAAVSGELDVNDGTLKATSHTSRYSTVGKGAGCTGLVTINGGGWEVNRSRIGQDGAEGTVVVNGGTFKVSRGNGGYSIWLDITSDAGITKGDLVVNGGLLSTRTGVQINDFGTFTVSGGASSIQIGGAGTGQCLVDVNPGGTLAVQVATNGLSAIEIDNDDTSDIPVASTVTFDPGSFLEPSFLDGYIETNAWVVMTLETSGTPGGAITADELALAAGVDPLWNFGVTNNPVDEQDVLWIGYAGAEYVPPEPPPTGTNVFVNSIVPMPDTWNLHDPDGGSSLSGQSSSGFTASFSSVDNAEWYGGYAPAVAQEFSSVRDLSQVGQNVTVKFDVVLLDHPDSNGSDFRLSFYDPDLNATWWWGLDLGTANSTTMRMLPYISMTDTNQFVPGDYGLLGLGYDSLSAVQSGEPDFGLSGVGITNYIEMTMSRIAADQVELSGIWTDTGNSTQFISYVFNETTPEYAVWAPIPDGKWDSVGGFGIQIFDAMPFSPLTVGRFMVSNFDVSSATQLPEGWGYSVSEIVVESSGDITLTLTDPIVGATYNVNGTTDLLHDVPGAVGTYVAVEPGVILVPAADAGLNTFFDVALPVIEVIE